MREINASMSKYSEISEADLDDLVASVQQSYPNCGQVMLQFFFATSRYKGSKISTSRQHW